MSRVRYILKMQAEPSGDDHLGRPASYRLRLALKRFLRDYGLRCVELRPDEPADDATETTSRTPSPAAIAKARRAMAAWRGRGDPEQEQEQGSGEADSESVG